MIHPVSLTTLSFWHSLFLSVFKYFKQCFLFLYCANFWKSVTFHWHKHGWEPRPLEADQSCQRPSIHSDWVPPEIWPCRCSLFHHCIASLHDNWGNQRTIHHQGSRYLPDQPTRQHQHWPFPRDIYFHQHTRKAGRILLEGTGFWFCYTRRFAKSWDGLDGEKSAGVLNGLLASQGRWICSFTVDGYPNCFASLFSFIFSLGEPGRSSRHVWYVIFKVETTTNRFPR